MDVSKIGKKFSMRSIFQIKLPVRKKIVFHPPKIAMPSVKLLSFREKKYIRICRYTYIKRKVWAGLAITTSLGAPAPVPPPAGGEDGGGGPGDTH